MIIHLINLQIEENHNRLLTIRNFLLKRILMVRGFLLYVDKACFRRKSRLFYNLQKVSYYYLEIEIN